MATTPQGEALTTAHSAAQARNAAIIAALLLRLWREMIDPTQLDSSALRWLDLVTPQVLTYRARSEDLAQAYYLAFREIEARGAPSYTPIPPSELYDPNEELAQIRASLSVTGIVQIEKKVKAIEAGEESIPGFNDGPDDIKKLIEQAVYDQAEPVAGSATRLVIQGGNDTIVENHKKDKIAFGYVRVAHPDCCFFCAMLASRGPVFKDDSFDNSNAFFNGTGPAKVHDNDRCTIQPVFSREDAGFQSSRDFKAIYDRVAAQVEPGSDFLYEFRRVYEGRQDGVRRGH